MTLEKICEKTTDKTNEKTTNDKADDKTKDVIVKELNKIHLEMQKLLLFKQVPSLKLVERVGELVKRLDNKVQPASETAVGKNSTLDVCPEEYKGGKFGYPFYEKGWVITNCSNAKPLRSVISVLINTVSYPKEDKKHIEKVLKVITETYPTVQVHLATRSNEVMEAAKKYNNIDVVKVDDVKVSKGWNTLMSKASTPYVLIARDVVHFTWLTQVERQIRVVSQTPNVAVAGGAYRNLSGHWKAGCVQTTLNNYVLGYQEGYYQSKNGCMYCNYLQGPFVTKTNLLKFDESLPNEVVFEDWFIRVVGDGNLIMTCPDAMYFTTDYTSYSKRADKNVWTPLAKKWELNRVLLPRGVKHSFSCKDVGFRCNAHSELLPVCCQEEYADALTFFQKFTDAHNATFELDTGSTLGGVKFNGLLPWDLDGDFVVLSKDIEIFNKKETIEHFKNGAYSLSGYKPPHFDNDKGQLINGFKPCSKPKHHACLQRFPGDGDIPFKVD
ncbi:hypothetical protein OS493_019119 [Desmophyllum pertusum]|uniref:Uncharacterized protein n=1 Tax=Desmophyllum pertusum TaxID=174260 RepID=A0A9W9YNE6_9CNID|nr:hypothetical protein OS493_019119 [Desmophyllum pertusum]